MNASRRDETPAAIAVVDLVKTYGRVKALDGVSFELPRGSFTALLGLNGAGKSTLMQILTGLFAADSGRVTVDGLSLSENPVAVLARLGIVFQQPSLDLDLTVAQNLAYFAGLQGLTGARRAAAIEGALSLFGLGGEIHAKVRKLSGGTRRKIELGRALMAEPSVLLLDEATQGLDPASRRDLVAHVSALVDRRKLTVLWATHIVSEVAEADAVIVLDRGRIVASGPPARILAEADSHSLEEAFLALTARSDRNRAA
jgi:ABC-2 type transport system ATP-binding protein